MSGTTMTELGRRCHRIDGRGYRAYRELRGTWHAENLTLHVEHVQGDPYATPSRLSITLCPETHGIPRAMWSNLPRRTALADYLLRTFARAARAGSRRFGTGHSGRIWVDDGGAEILPRSGCAIDDRALELRFRVGLPAQGRRVLGRAAAELLTEVLPRAAGAVHWSRIDPARVRGWVELCEDHQHLQSRLPQAGLIGFVRDGSILPRASGVSSRPLDAAVPFAAPRSMRVRFDTLHHGTVEGLAIPCGVTLITGGGFHGKTTLLQAIQAGVYPHVPGDGREWVVTCKDVVKVRSEDGRSVAGVDLRPFIEHLPGRANTARFETQDASGSTSLAAAILEAIEMGARGLLLDEDTSATNLLIRDARMQALVRRETITPLIDRVRGLFEEAGVSTMLVLGGSGDYLDVSDHVIMMEDYLPADVTNAARQVAARHPTRRVAREGQRGWRSSPRCPRPESFDPTRGRREKIKARGTRELAFGEQVIDLGALEQLVDDSQARAIGILLKRLPAVLQGGACLREAVEAVVDDAARRGLRALDPSPELALARSFEVAGAVNRLRSLALDTPPG